MQIAIPRILVVDDEPNVLMTVRAILREEGYEVDGCAGGRNAIGAVRERHYDLVLTDLKMPEVSGLEVLAAVRKSSPGTVTVMMTGYGSVGTAIDAIQLGAYEYLLKPVDVPELKAAVRRALERKRLSEIDTLYGVTQTLSRTLDRATIRKEVCDAVRRVLTLASAQLIIFDRDGMAVYEEGASCAPNRELLDAVSDLALVTRLLAHETVTDDTAVEPIAKWAAHAAIRSYALVPGVAVERLVCVLCVDNGRAPYEFHASALRFLNALASQAAVTLENSALVTELKRSNIEIASANQKLRELDKLKSQFLAIATHELRTPLSIILGYNAMLSESLHDRLTDDEQETLRESMNACRRLIGLVNSMLDISQIESGRMRMNFAMSDMAEIVRGVIALFHYEAERKGISLRVEVAGDLPPVRMDSERIQQVLTNLIGNALKFTSAGGSIAIAVAFHAESGQIEVSVKDSGIGIAAEHHTAIFEEFTKVDGQNSASHRTGSGLGLAIARRIVLAHRGAIRVNSEVGKGSTFTVTLPTNIPLSAVKTAMSA